MNKREYLRSTAVIDFSSWLEKIFDNESSNFHHAYTMERKKKNKEALKFNSLMDAHRKYHWPFTFHDYRTKQNAVGSSFEDSKQALSSLQNDLRKAVSNNDNEICYETCVMILDWGGVLGSSKRGNKKKLDELKSYLSEYLTAAQNLFENDVKISRKYEVFIPSKTSNIPVIMNAGFTKIYSLLCDDFIIYDGRVGAALGYLVRLYMEEKKPGELIPEELDFHFGNSRNSNVNRNPSKNGYTFKSLSTDGVHIRNNIKANWLASSLANNIEGREGLPENPLRALESSLFMIGYRV